MNVLLCPGYGSKQSDGEVPVMLGLWGMRSISPLLQLLVRLWPERVAPDRFLSMSQIDLFHFETVYFCLTQLFEIELFDHLTIFE